MERLDILSQIKADWAEQLLITISPIGLSDYDSQYYFCNICYDLPSQRIILYSQKHDCQVFRLSSHHPRVETENLHCLVGAA